MAYQARQHGPLLDGYWKQVIERRSKELLGLALFALGIALAAMLASYSASDPGLFSSTATPVRNWLGPTGAAVASPLMISVGFGSWFLAAFLAFWGFRYLIHAEHGRFMNRILLLPVAVMFSSIFMAAISSAQSWGHHFGLGGMFGDTVLAATLYAWPGPAGSGEGPIAWIAGVSLAVSAYAALGFTLRDLIYPLSMRRRSAEREEEDIGDARGTRRRKAEAAPVPEEPEFADEQPAPAPRRGLMRGLLRRERESAQPECIDPDSEEMDRAHPGESASPSRSIFDRVSSPFSKSREEAPHVQRPAPEAATAAEQAFARRTLAPEPPLTRFSGPKTGYASPQEADEFEQSADFQSAGSEPQPVPDQGPMQEPEHAMRPEPKRAVSRPEPAQPKYEGPPLDLLQHPARTSQPTQSEETLQENAAILESVLEDYGVKGTIDAVRPGPVVTLYELSPAPGLKASRVMGLSDDIARSMSALSARISTVPGRSVIGIELPNAMRENVFLKELIASKEFCDEKLKLPIALGKDIGGTSICVDLAAMPHLLIAGTTGSGKSVAINTMILSLLYKRSPEECRLIMIDPKMLELSVYDGIPHLLSPVVTDPKKAVVALKWVVGEMEERYRQMSKMGVRNIHGYNQRIKDALKENRMFSRQVQTGVDEQTGEPIIETEEYLPETFPFIVVIVDEMADLMMVAGKEIEACIQRLAQMARASGIHIVMATQRPSVDVITGTIKANFPTRVSFQVTSKVDSRTILGEQGAEQLLGKGDMIYMASGGKISRVHGPFVSDEDVEDVVNHLKELGEPEYVPEVLDGPSEENEAALNDVLGLNDGASDSQYDMAVSIVLKDRKCSTSYIQRKLGIGYNKAAKIVEQMEENGLISPANHVGKREILVPE